MHPTHARTGAVSLRRVLPDGRFVTGGDVVARSCSSDWRTCRPGDVFVAITTADDDGHEHVAEALDRGAIAVVAERLIVARDVPQLLVEDSRSAFARLSQALAGHPSRQLATVGITGTAGKTVTTMLAASIFEAAGQAAGVMSSLGHSDSVQQRVAPQATPTAAEFASWLRRMTVAGCQAAVLELGSQALAERRTSGIRLDAAVITNIKAARLDEHNTQAAYQRTKRRIFQHLKPGGVAIVNADDHRCRHLLERLQHARLTYALHAEADLTARVVERLGSEQTFFLIWGDQSVPVRTRMIGDQHVSNCLAAAAVGLAVGLPLETIARGLEAVERVPGRLERLEHGQSFRTFVDVASAPETLALALRAVRHATRGRLRVVYGSAASLTPAQRALVGRVLERGSDQPILTGAAVGAAARPESMHQVLDGFDRPQRAALLPDRAAAIRWALDASREGDAVLVAGCAGLADAERTLVAQHLSEPRIQRLPAARLRIVG